MRKKKKYGLISSMAQTTPQGKEGKMINTESVELAEVIGLIQLYVFDERGNRNYTQYGRISHLSWLKKEKKRIESKPNRQAMIVERKGLYALYVNPVALKRRERE
jgi:hypothetical protein